jgi:hypothetical protein
MIQNQTATTASNHFMQTTFNNSTQRSLQQNQTIAVIKAESEKKRIHEIYD